MTTIRSAVSLAKRAHARMNELGAAADKIGKIGKVAEEITEISEQTNLLAINATIEAAKDREPAGALRMANEIKELAKQTAETTAD